MGHRSSKPLSACLSRLPGLAVGEVEIGLPRATIRRLLPAAHDGLAVIADRRAEALRERFALAPELPPPVSDAHLVDAADAALVGVKLEVGPIGCVATHDRDAVGCLGHLHRRALHQVCARVVPFDRRPCLARPRRPVRRLGLQDPFADQHLEPLECLPCGWLVHRVAPPFDCSGNLIPTRYPHVIRLWSGIIPPFVPFPLWWRNGALCSLVHAEYFQDLCTAKFAEA